MHSAANPGCTYYHDVCMYVYCMYVCIYVCTYVHVGHAQSHFRHAISNVQECVTLKNVVAKAGTSERIHEWIQLNVFV